AGLGFHSCDVTIATNVAEDHLGLCGVDAMEKLARLKSTVPQPGHRNGYGILNAEDDLLYGMRKELDCKVARYALNPESRRIREHTSKGGLAAVYENGFITIMKGGWKIRVEKVSNIPITFNGLAEFNVANTMAAT